MILRILLLQDILAEEIAENLAAALAILKRLCEVCKGVERYLTSIKNFAKILINLIDL